MRVVELPIGPLTSLRKVGKEALMQPFQAESLRTLGTSQKRGCAGWNGSLCAEGRLAVEKAWGGGKLKITKGAAIGSAEGLGLQQEHSDFCAIAVQKK